MIMLSNIVLQVSNKVSRNHLARIFTKDPKSKYCELKVKVLQNLFLNKFIMLPNFITTTEVPTNTVITEKKELIERLIILWQLIMERNNFS